MAWLATCTESQVVCAHHPGHLPHGPAIAAIVGPSIDGMAMGNGHGRSEKFVANGMPAHPFSGSFTRPVVGRFVSDVDLDGTSPPPVSLKEDREEEQVS